ncbi:MAG TPA: hypothetical protein VMH33_04060 [Solirubrobacterales bacterium]|nr:hypothetical protein [Solirubrobacterales bacterium]
MRLALTLVVVLAAALVAGCGGSSDETATVGDGQTVTVPGDVHGVYGELEAILGQLPYQAWYTKCVVAHVEKVLSPAEAEELAKLPESERNLKAMEVTAKAGPACEEASDRPVVDPNASSKELGLLRAGYATSIKTLAETEKLTAAQVACVEGTFEEVTDREIVVLGNGSEKEREGILLSVFKPCVKAK